MIQLVASDIDGTLVQGDAPISPRLFRQIRALKAHGIPFLVSSGRQYDSLLTLFAPVKDEIYYLCQNGAVVFAHGAPLFTSIIPLETAKELSREILSIPECEVLISFATGAYVLPKQASYVTLMREVKHSNVTILSSLEEITQPVTKIAAYCPRSGAAGLEPRFDRWRGTLNVAIGGPNWLDFGLADKATGLLPLCQQLGVGPAHVMAFGDNYNDTAILDLVGHPYIMSSAVSSELRQRYPNCNSVEEELDRLLAQLG
jgi:hypothetical protein